MLPVYSPESHSLYQDFLISNFLLLYPDRHGRSSYSSGIWIFPRLQASFWVLILNSDLLHEIQFPCCVLTCFLLNSRSLPLLIGYPDSKNVLYMRSSVDSPLMMCQASVPFTISSGALSPPMASTETSFCPAQT